MTVPSAGRKRLCLWCLLAFSCAGLCAGAGLLLRGLLRPPDPPPLRPLAVPRQLMAADRLTVWWDVLPAPLTKEVVPSGKGSNIHPKDYVGPDTCKACHEGNHAAWSAHPHRWMNVPASDETVRGDFSGAATIAYRGGRATFARQEGKYLMRLERGALRRTYQVTQTIGSRFYQYYVGRQLEGPEPSTHHFYAKEHVLPFGYWLSAREWVPVVHIGPERPDEERPDPFDPPQSGRHYAEYAYSCNHCHTTFALGDLLGRRSRQMAAHVPLAMHWSMRPYLEEAHPDVARLGEQLLLQKDGQNPMDGWEASRYAMTFGISCEACHLGGREHASSGGRVPPRFLPASPHLSFECAAPPDPGRTQANVNWACGRCHTGGRPAFAAGMSTWNSVEYADAMRGSCYSQLRCIDCHNPHRALGSRWSWSADRDDAVCLKCHDKFSPAQARVAHTHHPMGSEGARCQNCHMPRINEGLQDVVRTHMIYSPTRADMIEANHPNACNLCHTDRPIDWTLRHLKGWYGKTFDEGKVAAAYPRRDQGVAEGWLRSADPAVRLVGADALARSRKAEVVPLLLEALDDPYLLNRQFAARGLEEQLGVRPRQAGYHFWMQAQERRGPLAELRRARAQR